MSEQACNTIPKSNIQYSSQLFIMTEYLIKTVPDGRYLGYAPDKPGSGIPPPPQPIVILPAGTRASKVGYTSYHTFGAKS